LSDTLRGLDKMVTDPEIPLTEITAEVTGTAIALTERSPELQMGTAAEGMAALNAHLDELDAGTKQDVCVSTGISLLDQAIDGGMIPGLHVYAAFTGNGKTTMAYHTALTVCRQGGVVVFASTEHDKARVYQEMLAIVAGVPAAAVRSGTFRRADPIGFSRASATLAAMNLYVFHFEGHQGMPFEVLETAIHVTSLKYGRVDLVVVDWMQDMQVPTSIANVKEPEKLVQTKLTYIVPRLKDLAINTGVPMIGTAQLTKESLTGGLELSYIAGSAEIARRAETALLFGRAQTHDRSRPDKNTFLIKVGKKRAQGDYPYFDNHFRLDPVSRQITTMLGEPVHPAQFRPTVSAADDMPADLYPSTSADDESMVDF
jgi:replicative DNA helicase